MTLKTKIELLFEMKKEINYLISFHENLNVNKVVKEKTEDNIDRIWKEIRQNENL